MPFLFKSLSFSGFCSSVLSRYSFNFLATLGLHPQRFFFFFFCYVLPLGSFIYTHKFYHHYTSWWFLNLISNFNFWTHRLFVSFLADIGKSRACHCSVILQIHIPISHPKTGLTMSLIWNKISVFLGTRKPVKSFSHLIWEPHWPLGCLSLAYFTFIVPQILYMP